MSMNTEQSPQGAPGPSTGRTKTWVRVLLAVSLTLNLMVVGVVVGAVSRDGHDNRRAGPPDRTEMRAGGFAPFFDAMPRATRGRLGAALHERGAAVRPDRVALAAEAEAIVAAIRAEPFDRAALEGLLTAQHARASSRAADGRAVLLGEIAAMDAEARGAFADRLERGFGRASERARNRD